MPVAEIMDFLSVFICGEGRRQARSCLYLHTLLSLYLWTISSVKQSQKLSVSISSSISHNWLITTSLITLILSNTHLCQLPVPCPHCTVHTIISWMFLRRPSLPWWFYILAKNKRDLLSRVIINAWFLRLFSPAQRTEFHRRETRCFPGNATLEQ